MDIATALPLPTPADLGPAHFRFTSVSYTPATIEVDIEVTGVSSDQLWRIVPNGVKGEPALPSDLFDPSGALVNGKGNRPATRVRITFTSSVFAWAAVATTRCVSATTGMAASTDC